MATSTTRNVGYLGITLDATLSAMNIHEACTTGDDKACQVVAYREVGRLVGSMGGGSIGAGASYGCVALGVGTAGIGGVACVVLVGGIGAAAGSYAGSEFGEFAGEILREAIHE